ncbi:hypothetical protein [Neotabrizicola sp. sgz301269]|uniref:hypothetical protein n=1 Tax=Neotabrizicola sp. sgz301269 TaxID=3276282 RepID=UPI00376FDCB9
MTASLLDAVRKAWGEFPPDWIEALAKASARSSQAVVARDLGRSPAVISQVLRKIYPADTARIEERVRGLYMNGTVDCPALGSLSTLNCQDWREKSTVFAHGNPLRARMFRACNACPRFPKEAEE